MKFKNIFRIATLVIALMLTMLAVYEGHAVSKASQNTGEILSTALEASLAIDASTLTKRQREILLKVEDPNFYQHNGLDFSSPGQGLTTISQALVKLFYFENFEPGFDKLEQSLIAWLVVDRRWSKDQQLTIFVNWSYLGHKNGRRIQGFNEASLHYYDKPFDQITEDEFIGLVGMLIAPNHLRPDRFGEAHRQRIASIKKMLSGACQPTGLFDVWYRECL